MKIDSENKNVSVPTRRPSFFSVAVRGIQIAIFVDIGFFFLFYALGSPFLAWVNVISIAMYISAYHSFKNRKNLRARVLIYTEVLIHAALGIIIIGWDSGFHYFLLLFIPAICLSSTTWQRRIALSALFTYYTALAFLMYFIEPIQPINSFALQIVHTFNLCVVFFMFSYLSLYYLNTVKAAQKKLQVLATTDPLTTLFNRRHMNHLIQKETSELHGVDKPIAILLVDVDHFKNINDQFGHEMGDKVLVHVAKILKQKTRKQDLISRWGGEEFLVILPDADSEDGLKSAERIRIGFTDYDWQGALGVNVGVTISAGVSLFQKYDSLSDAMARADKALYKGKANGRNRVELHAD